MCRKACHAAAGEGHDSCVLVLASNGADVNMFDGVSVCAWVDGVGWGGGEKYELGGYSY